MARAGAATEGGAWVAGAYGRAAGYLGYLVVGLSLGRGVALPAAAAAAVALAAAAATGITPASIGLVAGAVTVTGWALWRRGGPGR